MPNLNTKPLIEIRKDENGVYWIEYVEGVSTHEALGILVMMAKRLEGAIEKEEIKKTELK